MTRPISRRDALEQILVGLGLGLVAISAGACAPRPADGSAPPLPLPAQVPGGDVPATARFSDDVAALCDVLLPTEYDAKGKMTVAGAREADVDGTLRIQQLAAAAIAAGLIAPLADADVQRLSGSADALRATMNAELVVLAARHRPLTAFRDLPRALQETIVTEAFQDDAQKPLLLLARAGCFLAWLGAVSNDVGLRAVGFPPFESFTDGRAVSGYPRTMSGRLVDASSENLAALAAKGDLDDYTYNQDPGITPGDDLTLVLDDNGDLF